MSVAFVLVIVILVFLCFIKRDVRDKNSERAKIIANKNNYVKSDI